VASGVGLLSNATSRFTIDIEPITNVADTFNIQSLQLVPGVDGERVMKFKFFDSANHEYDFTIELSDAQFEAFNIFGGTKSKADEAAIGGSF
jgi:hypothetical protein